MKNWLPSDKERKCIDLIIDMCLDCRMGRRGIGSREKFTSKIRMITNDIDKLPHEQT